MKEKEAVKQILIEAIEKIDEIDEVMDDVITSVRADTLSGIDINKMLESRPVKPKFEDLHTKDNVWIRNELHHILNTLSKGNKGEKTRIVNEALLLYFQVQSGQ